MRYLALLSLLAFSPIAQAADDIDFGRDIRPILSNKCFKCHGPATQKGKLRLDDRAAAIAKEAITPGKPGNSELLKRLTLPDSDEGRMPPVDVGDRLTPDEIAKLTAWIKQGAEYKPHWAFVAPRRHSVPEIRNPKLEIRNEIDRFIIAKLSDKGLSLSPEADRSTLLRRVTLDLTGLLPTPQELDDFLKDTSPDAYEKVVNRLLASPHYGERQARHWLDLARYADSNGYTIDGARSIWPYRDWVIKALNDDMPFDQFTREQLAGDLLPNATMAQKIATGFHRNTSFNEEGGTDAEQFRVERTVDRANTTAAVWLGLTMGCSQCHDHKYDPLSQKDYYRLYAFFDSCDEPTMPISGDPRLEDMITKLQHMEAWIQKNGGSREDIAIIQKQIKKLQGGIPTTLVMRERPKQRDTYVQIRGDFLRKGELVKAAFPTAISSPAMPKKLSRLDLAKWLTSAENPLTARVTVNREWQKFFGRGIVETENDFGYQGNFPTHPELLDWLAVEFRERGWYFKTLHKLIVMSATYRQSSAVTPELAKVDPRNLLLGRQSRLRLEAEIIRDASLCASGQFNPKVGGPGVYPPQPKEVFAFTQSNHPWVESKGPERYRRGMYTYIWRQSQHHLLTTFDAADAQTSCTRRNRSNTPLQALHMANDPVFVELANLLGQRIEKEGPTDDAGKIAFAFGSASRVRRRVRRRPACRRISTRSARPTRRPRGPPWPAC
ncbi:MAG: PSD1 and planctomycete cytochrome C domain-containing protein [Gemmataceae bacterium]